eukprot:gene47968-65064_t
MINEIENSNVMKTPPSVHEQGSKRTWSRAARHVIACSVIAVLSASSALAQIAVSTLAGASPSIQSGNTDATGTAALFNSPTSIAVDSSGNIYVADQSNHKIRKVTSL